MRVFILLQVCSFVIGERCSNIKCSNIIDYVCGVAERGSIKVIRTFHNICHMNRIKCKLMSIAHIRQVEDSLCNIKRKQIFYTTGRRLADFSIVGAHQACNHTCPTYCVDTYEPACAQIWTTPDSYKYRPMINHCHIDLLSCAAGVSKYTASSHTIWEQQQDSVHLSLYFLTNVLVLKSGLNSSYVTIEPLGKCYKNPSGLMFMSQIAAMKSLHLIEDI